MATSSPAVGAPAAVKTGVACVSSTSKRQHRAHCTCGWADQSRWVYAIAALKVWFHCANEGCEPALWLSEYGVMLAEREARRH